MEKLPRQYRERKRGEITLRPRRPSDNALKYRPRERLPATILEAALAYAKAGYRVFPCNPKKRPLIDEWPTAASTSSLGIRGWWSTWPDALIAIPTGEVSGLVVLDIDVKHDNGFESVERLGLVIPDDAPRVTTPSGGEHYYFKLPQGISVRNSAGRIGPGIDVRGEGGFIIAPPSKGYQYDCEAIHFWLQALANAPEAPAFMHRIEEIEIESPGLAEPIRPHGNGSTSRYARAALNNECESVASAVEGTRNDRLNRAAYSIGGLAKGGEVSEGEARAALTTAARQAGLDDDEISATIASGLRSSEPRQPRPQGAARHSDVSSVQGEHLHVVNASDVTPKPVRWVWPRRLARGRLTVCSGLPGLGKSQLSTDIAARITRGLPWPDGGTAPLGNVVILSAEDSADDTIVPRLIAAKGDRSRVKIAGMIVGPIRRRLINLKQDLHLLQRDAFDAETVLLIVDPISAYLGETESNSMTAVRPVLDTLADFAEHNGCAVLAIHHPPKNMPKQAVHAFSGSLAFAAAPRLAFIVHADEQMERTLLLSAKSNLGPPAEGLGFTIEPYCLRDGIETSKVVWDSNPVHLTATEAMQSEAGTGKREEAKDWLRAKLADGAVPSNEVMDDAERNGLRRRTLMRAKEELGIESEKQGFTDTWLWHLPRRR